MIMNVFAVYDRKVGAYMAPQFFRAKGEAIRAFMDVMVRDENLRKHAEDYFFAFLGTYDDSLGSFTCLVHGPEAVMQGLDAVQIEQSPN